LVTGGLGFIGSHLTEKLVQDGHNVLIVDDESTGNINNICSIPSTKYTLCKSPIRAALGTIQDYRPEYIFHLAAWPRIQPSYLTPIEHDENNVRETIRLIKLASKLAVKAFVYSSSSSCYGNPDPNDIPTSEHAPIRPLNPYAIQKYASEQYVISLGRHFSVPHVALRYFNVYGPRSYNPSNPMNAYSSVVGIFNNRALNGQCLQITGDGKQTRDFIHVFDVVAANIMAMKKINLVSGQVMNVGSGRPLSVLSIASMFNVPTEFIPARSGEAICTHACIDEIVALGWKPSVTVEEAIQRGLI